MQAAQFFHDARGTADRWHSGTKLCPIYITHTKPSETELIMAEIRQFDARTLHGFDAPHDIRWLRAGDVLEV